MEAAVYIIQGGDHLEEADDHQYKNGQDDGEDDLTCPLGTKQSWKEIFQSLTHPPVFRIEVDARCFAGLSGAGGMFLFLCLLLVFPPRLCIIGINIMEFIFQHLLSL